MATPDQLLREVLTLPDREREELLRALLESLDEPGEDEGHAAAWDVEIESRMRDDDEGDSAFIDGPEAIRRVRSEILGE